MASFIDRTIDGGGTKRGACSISSCDCHQFCRKEHSVKCECEHVGVEHFEFAICVGTRNDGRKCNCSGYTPPILPDVTQCLNCGHELGFHPTTGCQIAQRTTMSNMAAFTRPASVYGLEETAFSVIVRSVQIRTMALEQRRVDMSKSRDKKAKPCRGGFRPGAGRKAVEKGRVHMPHNFTMDELKAKCRDVFAVSIPNVKNVHSSRDSVYKHMKGLPIDAETNIEELIGTRCCYYNEAFDELEWPQTKSRKRKSELAYDSDENIENDEGILSCNVEPKDCSTSSRLGQTRYTDNGEDSIVSSERRNLEIDDVNSCTTSLYTAHFETDVDHCNSMEAASSTGTLTIADQIQSANLLAETYQVQEGMAKLFLEFCSFEYQKAADLIGDVLFPPAELDVGDVIFQLFLLFGYGVKPQDDQSDDEDDKVRFKISWLKSIKDEKERAHWMREQIMRKWKEFDGKFGRLAQVKFDDAGVGRAVDDSYLQILRTYILDDLFDGGEDHKVPQINASKIKEEAFKFGGKLLAHIARYRQFVYPGLAEFVKEFLCGLPVEQLRPSIDDIPEFDIQELLKKIVTVETLDHADEVNLSNLILEAGMHTVPGVHYDTALQINRIVDNQEDIVDTLVYHFAVTKRIGQLQQLRDGLDEVCRISSFYKTGQFSNGACVFRSLLMALFPPVAEVTCSRSALEKSLKIVGVSESSQTKMFCILERVVSSLSESHSARNSVTNFILSCTAMRYVSDGDEIIFEIKPAAQFQEGKPVVIHACTKTIHISEKSLESDESMGMLVEHIKAITSNDVHGFDLV